VGWILGDRQAELRPKAPSDGHSSIKHQSRRLKPHVIAIINDTKIILSLAEKTHFRSLKWLFMLTTVTVGSLFGHGTDFSLQMKLYCVVPREKGQYNPVFVVAFSPAVIDH
jgi:hypothetical protein